MFLDESNRDDIIRSLRQLIQLLEIDWELTKIDKLPTNELLAIHKQLESLLSIILNCYE